MKAINNNPAPNTEGDLGEFIIAELAKRGISVPKTSGLPKLPATWRIVKVTVASSPNVLGAVVRGCTLAAASAFCFSLFASFREARSLSSDASFFFNVAGVSGHYSTTSTGLVVSFLSLQKVLTVGRYEDGVHIGFSDRAVA